MDEREVNNEELEETLEDVMDMEQVKANEETALGKTTMSVGREAATRTSDKIDLVDKATKVVEEGVRQMEETQKNAQDKTSEAKATTATCSPTLAVSKAASFITTARKIISIKDTAISAIRITTLLFCSLSNFFIYKFSFIN